MGYNNLVGLGACMPALLTSSVLGQFMYHINGMLLLNLLDAVAANLSSKFILWPCLALPRAKMLPPVATWSAHRTVGYWQHLVSTCKSIAGSCVEPSPLDTCLTAVPVHVVSVDTQQLNGPMRSFYPERNSIE